ncbi:hypothetical protein L4C54_12915 [Vibrio lamellibrachiae]|uniref:hypothetical protein n=1 Tax=Vibrio lamellibrachiae TaxID=2910253 RepID=UPI003D0E1997
MTVFRLHTRPKGGLANAKVSFDYCLRAGVLGLGWQTESQDNTATWGEFTKEAFEAYGEKELSRVKYLKNNVVKDDLIWTRDTEGHYYLGKVNSGWEYFSNDEAKDADIVNVVRCDINKVTTVDDVPGKVIACFRPSRTIQAIRDKTADDYSKYLWNKISNTEYYDLPKESFKNVFSFLDSEETEDVIFVYLQTQGWIIIPNSRKADTMSYEFYLINRISKEKAIVQVKTGYTSLTPREWEDRKEKVFLFQANNQYKGQTESEHVVSIDPSVIEKFMYNNKDLLPSNIVHWLELADSEKKMQPLL